MNLIYDTFHFLYFKAGLFFSQFFVFDWSDEKYTSFSVSPSKKKKVMGLGTEKASEKTSASRPTHAGGSRK